METLHMLRTTAQQVENTLYEWLEGTACSPARFQILVVLWALNGGPVPHQDVIAALRVKRATVSELMAVLERDGLIVSSEDVNDRRKLLASLTKKGETVVARALDINTRRLEMAFKDLTKAEMRTFTALLHRVRQRFEQQLERTASEPDSQFSVDR